MLVLTRKINESICIDGGIEVMVVAIRGNKVRLGFRAPTDVSIQRKERAEASSIDVHDDEDMVPVAEVAAAHVGPADRQDHASFLGNNFDES